MTPWREPADTVEHTGPVGPVALLAFLFLVGLAPLMRGGNRNIALIVLEGVALAFLVALLWAPARPMPRPGLRGALLILLLASPVWLALVYLLPLPRSLWSALAGRADYPGALATAGVPVGDWLPLSLVPDATAASLLAGIPLVAAFLAGFWLRRPQLQRVFLVAVALAFAQVLLGLAQAAGGNASSLYFGGDGGRPFGTFANPNHFANYVAMALAAYVWLAWTQLAQARHRAITEHDLASTKHRLALWAAGGLFLVVGILMSRSRGAMLAGLPAALGALAITMAAMPRARSWRTILSVTGGAILVALLLVGFDFVVSRFQLHKFASDASFRALLASSTLDGAAQLFPWGAGWGTYALVYPRFQPEAVVGTANQAHHDYAQLLFEGGIFALLLMVAFALLAGARVVHLVRSALRHHRLRHEEILCAVCGLGLAGFLLHSVAEFNMHIPANAIMASLLAGVFLRPLANGNEEPAGD